MQAPHDHIVVGVVPRVPDVRVLKDPAIGPQNIVRPGPHPPPYDFHTERFILLWNGIGYPRACVVEIRHEALIVEKF